MFLGYDNVGAFLEAVRPWITPVGITAILGIVLKWQLGVRKLRIEAAQVEVTAKQVANVDEADIRDHYADEVRQLRERMDAQSARHQTILRDYDARHEACQKDREKLRDDARELKDIVSGLIRIITQASASKAIFLGDAASAEVSAAAHRVDTLFRPNPKPSESKS